MTLALVGRIPDNGLLPDGWVESTLLPALTKTDLEPDQLLGLDEDITRAARSYEDHPSRDEWKRAVAVVRRRIGEQLEDGRPGNSGKTSNANDVLDKATRDRRSDYRLLASVPLETFIAWTREDPRWSILIPRARAWRSEHADPDEQSSNGRLLRRSENDRAEQIRHLAGGGHRAAQIADKLGISRGRVIQLANKHDIELPLAQYRSTIDPGEVIENIVKSLEADITALDLIEGMKLDADRTQIECWVDSLDNSLLRLRKLRNQLRELTHDRH